MRMRDLKTRTVLLLGRRPSVNWDRVAGGLRQDDELVVLSLGYPVTAAQREVLLRAQEISAEVGAWFDALLVTSRNEMLLQLLPDDDVHVAANGREARRLRSALAASAG